MASRATRLKALRKTASLVFFLGVISPKRVDGDPSFRSQILKATLPCACLAPWEKTGSNWAGPRKLSNASSGGEGGMGPKRETSRESMVHHSTGRVARSVISNYKYIQIKL